MTLLPPEQQVGISPPDDRLDVVHASCPYMAAAEMLAQPAAALVVDLGLVPAHHVGLLDLAAEMGLPIVACGTVAAPVSRQTMSHIRLTSRQEAVRVLEALLEEDRQPRGDAAGLASAEARGAGATVAPPPSAKLASRAVADMPAGKPDGEVSAAAAPPDRATTPEGPTIAQRLSQKELERMLLQSDDPGQR